MCVHVHVVMFSFKLFLSLYMRESWSCYGKEGDGLGVRETFRCFEETTEKVSPINCNVHVHGKLFCLILKIFMGQLYFECKFKF